MPSEVRSVSSTGGEKGTKDERHSLLPPEALAAVARHYGVGAQKYSAHNWRRGYEWSKSYDALQRHATAFWSGEDIDEETGSPHMAAVAFHAFTLLVFMAEQREFDDRYTAEAPEPDRLVLFKTGYGSISVEHSGRHGDWWCQELRDGRTLAEWAAAGWVPAEAAP